MLALTSLGCGGVDPGSATPTSENGTCGAGAGQDAPDLMAWDAAARANLSQLRKRGVVAVRYERSGCEVRLELLPECVVEASRAYHYEPYARSETK